MSNFISFVRQIQSLGLNGVLKGIWSLYRQYIVSPTGGETGNRNIEIAGEFVFWNRQRKLAKLFDSSTCFRLPNGGDRSPDVAWIRQDRWDTLTPAEKESFPPIAPDFVLELRSPTDRLQDTQAKMQDYLQSGVRLGWLIDGLLPSAIAKLNGWKSIEPLVQLKF